MSTALYNRYRPATFAQVVGQEHVTDALRKALRTGRLHHAYLFSGPRGCGKTSSARILAASLNCEQGPTPEPCGVCDECVGIRTGASMDVTEIDAASHGLVDDARDLRERAFFAPASARFKVFVVDEAHMVTTAAFNALLKVVEEPPPYLKFVFATTEPDKVIPTIRSRTHHYAFRLVPPGVLRTHLASICEQEGVTVDPAVLPLVVRAGAGSVRDSLSVLDQLLAGADDDGLHYDRAVTLLGMTDGVLLDETVDALAQRDGAALFTVVDKVVSAGHDPRRFATDLLDRFRDLIVMAAVPDADARGLLESFSPDQIDRMRAQAAAVGPAELSRTADVLHGGLVEMRGTTSPRLMLELILARALLPAASADPAALLTRLERLERRSVLAAPDPAAGRPAASHSASAPGVGSGPVAANRPFGEVDVPAGPAGPAQESAPTRPAPAQPARAAAAPASQGPAEGSWSPAPAAGGMSAGVPTGAAGYGPPPAGAGFGPPPGGGGPAASQGRGPGQSGESGGRIDAAGLRMLWNEVLMLAGRRSRKTHAILKDHATIADVRGDEVILAFASPTMGRMFGQGNNAEVFCAALTEKIGGTWRVSVAPAGGSGPGRDGGRPAGGPPPPGGGFGSQPGSGPAWAGPDQRFGGGAPVPAAGGRAGGTGPGQPTSGHWQGPDGGGHSGYQGHSGYAPTGEVPGDVDGGGRPPAPRPTTPAGWALDPSEAPAGDHRPGQGGNYPRSPEPASPAHHRVGNNGSGEHVGDRGQSPDAAHGVVRQRDAGTHVAGQNNTGQSGAGQHGVGHGVGHGAVGESAPGQGGGAPGPAGDRRGGQDGGGPAGTGGHGSAGGDGTAVARPVNDEPSLDDDDAPGQAGGARGGAEAAMSLLRTGLGATIIEQIPTS